MPACPRTEFATQQIDEVRRQLLDAAAFGKHITPDQLERMASKLAAGVQALDLRAGLGTGISHIGQMAAD
jgi:hypothetical protein